VADEESNRQEQNLDRRATVKPAHYFGLVELKNAKNSEISYVKQVLVQAVFLVERMVARFHQAIAREFETGLAFHFSPIFISAGILLYYTVLFALVVSPLVLFIVLRALTCHGNLYYFLAACLCISLGMLAAKLEASRNAAPIIERQITSLIKGVVLNVDQNSRGSLRYLVKPVSIEGVPHTQLPKAIRASTATKHEAMLPGESIEGRIRLQPVTGPLYPGGYDFSFFAWQDGLGGSGFFLGKPERAGIETQDLSLGEKFQIRINRIRKAIERRVLKALPDYTGGIAVALITGNRTGIPKDAQESLRKTGLAHILAISGLHMTLVSLTLISTIRFFLSRNTYLVLHYPIKKWAVIAGFISASIYLFLSGGAVATQRAWIMISVMLLAILLDRKGITIRNVVISAILILMISPSSLLSPGFQMSFAAVASLVAGYEIINNQRQKRFAERLYVVQLSRMRRMFGDIGRYFAGIATTSLIAGTATAFVAAWHFHQVAPLGLIANLLAMPIVALIVMPSLLAAMILMPYGLDFIPFMVASNGIDWIIQITSWIEMRSPNGNTGLISRHMLMIFATFLAMLTLMKSRLRYLSFLLIPLLFFGFRKEPPPDIIIAENGRALAVKTQSDALHFLYPRASKFTLNIWEKAWGRVQGQSSDLKIDECTKERCIIQLPNGKMFYVVYNPDLLQDACNATDILAAPRLWWVNCKEQVPELILKRHDFEQYGTHAIYFHLENKGTPIRINTSLPEPSRPWHRRVSEKQ